MCSRGEAVFEAEETEEAAAGAAAAVPDGAVAPGLSVDSIFNMEDEPDAPQPTNWGPDLQTRSSQWLESYRFPITRNAETEAPAPDR